MNDSPEISLYEELGGGDAVRKLVDDFYDFMDSAVEVQGIRKQHNTDLSEAREKLFMFLSGWLGGPQLYVQQFGHPRLRARHLPFKIGISERDQWMMCMAQALQKTKVSEQTRNLMYKSLLRLADHMRNQPEN